jgi:hypothetical protein
MPSADTLANLTGNWPTQGHFERELANNTGNRQQPTYLTPTRFKIAS